MNTKRLIVLAAIETVVIALGVCLLLFAFRYTPPSSTPYRHQARRGVQSKKVGPTRLRSRGRSTAHTFRKRLIQRAWPRTASNLRGCSRKWPTFPKMSCSPMSADGVRIPNASTKTSDADKHGVGPPTQAVASQPGAPPAAPAL